MANEIKDIRELDNMSEEMFFAYIEKCLNRNLNDEEKRVLPEIRAKYSLTNASLFLLLSYRMAEGKGLGFFEAFVKDFIQNAQGYEAIRLKISRIMQSKKLDEAIHAVVGIKEIDNRWRDYFAQWKEWGVSDADIKKAKMICLKRMHSVIPQYMNGIIKEDILRKRRK